MAELASDDDVPAAACSAVAEVDRPWQPTKARPSRHAEARWPMERKVRVEKGMDRFTFEVELPSIRLLIIQLFLLGDVPEVE
jgi:hypothetical protein